MVNSRPLALRLLVVVLLVFALFSTAIPAKSFGWSGCANFHVTFYFAPPGARTKTGTVPHYGTVSVDPSVIALGDQVSIAGVGNNFTAEDTGSAVIWHTVDVYVTSWREGYWVAGPTAHRAVCWRRR